MSSFLSSSITHWRTTLPGIGLAAIAFGHWWATGAFSVDDFMAVIASTGLIAVQKPAA